MPNKSKRKSAPKKLYVVTCEGSTMGEYTTLKAAKSGQWVGDSIARYELVRESKPKA